LPSSLLKSLPVVALVALAGMASIPTEAGVAHAATAVTTAAAVTCVKRPAVQPPRVIALPKPLKGVSAGLRPAPAVKPVCPSGAVPVVKGQSRTLAKAVPGLVTRPASGPAALAPTPPPPPPPGPPKCDGVIYPFDPNTCFYYAGASETRDAQGGGLTMAIERPAYVGTGGPGHTLEEMSVQGGPSNGNIVEIGSSVSTDQFGDSDPHLFVYHWVNGTQTCYSCNWQQYSNTYYPGMNLAGQVGQQVYNGYVYYQGNWWAWYNDQWVGFFPGSLWNGAFQTSQLIQWFGEVATQNGLPPRTQMGDGLFPTNAAAAPMSTLCDVDAKAWVCWYRDQQVTYRTDPAYYDIAHTGFGAIRLGGPGT
jgi:neprosin-like protein